MVLTLLISVLWNFFRNYITCNFTVNRNGVIQIIVIFPFEAIQLGNLKLFIKRSQEKQTFQNEAKIALIT
jgi:hypothetical protein